MTNLFGRAVRYLYDLIVELVKEWQKDRVSGLAAEISFYALLSLIPMILALTGFLGSVDALFGEGFAVDAETWIVEQLSRVFGTGTGVDEEVSSLFSGSSTSALTIGSLLAVYAASRGMRALISALDVAYDDPNKRGFWSTRLVGIALTFMTIIVGVVVLAMVVIGPLFGRGEELATDLGFGAGFETFWAWFRLPTVFLVLVAWAATIYHVAPNHRSPWKYELPGAVLFAVSSGLFTVGFSLYLNRYASNTNAFFGVIGSVLSVLLWMYLLAIGLLLGAELNSILAQRAGVSVSRKRPEPFRKGYARARDAVGGWRERRSTKTVDPEVSDG